MRKTLIVFGLALALAAPVAAGWPEGYQGDEIDQGCFPVALEISEWYDMNPWGQRSPVGVQAIGDLCVDGGVATLSIDYIVNEVCNEPAWGARDQAPTCKYYVRVAFNEPARVLPFVDGAYIAYVIESGDIAPYEALVWDADVFRGRFIDGVFDFVSPLWFYESDQYTRVTWEVKPLFGEVIFPRVRRGSRR